MIQTLTRLSIPPTANYSDLGIVKDSSLCSVRITGIIPETNGVACKLVMFLTLKFSDVILFHFSKLTNLFNIQATFISMPSFLSAHRFMHSLLK